MNLSANTISVLKNFADINENILFKPGKTLKTVSNSRTVMAQADIQEEMPQEFGIYNLNELLRAFDLYQKYDINFNGGQSMTIKDANSKSAIKYFFSDKSVLSTIEKSIELPDKYVTFSLKKDDFANLMRASVQLNLPDIIVEGDGSKVVIKTLDRKSSTSNVYDIEIGSTDKTFKAMFKKENFKMIPGDYDIAISKAKISHFINRSANIQYWIAIEPDSEF